MVAVNSLEVFKVVFFGCFFLQAFSVQCSSSDCIERWLQSLFYILQYFLNERNNLCNSIYTENDQKTDMNYWAII